MCRGVWKGSYKCPTFLPTQSPLGKQHSLRQEDSVTLQVIYLSHTHTKCIPFYIQEMRVFTKDSHGMIDSLFILSAKIYICVIFCWGTSGMGQMGVGQMGHVGHGIRPPRTGWAKQVILVMSQEGLGQMGHVGNGIRLLRTCALFEILSQSLNAWSIGRVFNLFPQSVFVADDGSIQIPDEDGNLNVDK